ncbi:MAG: FAD-binding oxidoreductase [Flavobacterium sp.]|nr:FAD-binding oxidoreductase [Flavobacterium sp.]
MHDYIIVGCGLAGIAFAEKALQNSKSIIVINNQSQNASKVAGGLYNPVVLKRFSQVWNANEQLELLDVFYSDLEKKLKIKLDYKLPLLRKFYSIEEQNNWFIASDKPNLSNFLSTKLIFQNFKFVTSPYGFGEVLYSGYIDTQLLVNEYQNYLKQLNLYLEESFNHSLLQVEADFVTYKNYKARHIVFAEGFGMLLNPFFTSLPLDGTKGELLIIRAPNLDFNVILKTSIFVVPLGSDLYKVGATYNWDDKSNAPTDVAKLELIDNLKDLIACDFEIVEHRAGVRPTVKDRKPLVGTHYQYKNVHLLNGLGTRGVMLAPAMARDLYNLIEHKIQLDMNVDIRRIKNYGKF